MKILNKKYEIDGVTNCLNSSYLFENFYFVV